MPRLRRARCAGPGITRRRRGRGWAYYDASGQRVTDPDPLARIEALVIPPAWTAVWICPFPNGHIQALGTDARGRRQYRYHDAWRVQRDGMKFDRVLDFAAALPPGRGTLAVHLAERGLTRNRVLACTVRLLDLGFFRIDSEQYAEENGTYGLATLRREHVSVTRSGLISFDYIAKHGKQRLQAVVDPEVRDVVRALKRRPGGGPELFAYRTPTGWTDIRSSDINAYVRNLCGGEYSAKDFRTWHATVLAAVGLSVSTHAATSPTVRRRAVTRVIKEVADYLGNTPAVCRSAYIDPRAVDLYENGTTIADDLDQVGGEVAFGQLATQGAVEAAVLTMLRGPAEEARQELSA